MQRYSRPAVLNELDIMRPAAGEGYSLIFMLAQEFGTVFGEAREDFCSFAKEFGSVRKELYSAAEEFGLAKLLSC